MSDIPCQCCESPTDPAKIPNNNDMQHLVEIMFLCFSIKLPGDGVKVAICCKCIPKLIKSYNFKRMVERSQVNLAVNVENIAPEPEPCKIAAVESAESHSGSPHNFDDRRDDAPNDDEDLHSDPPDSDHSLPSPPMIETKNDNPNEFVCDTCGKVFSKKEGLSTHKRIHVKLRCHVCDKDVSKSEFGKHSRSHVDSRIYRCCVCPQRFLHYHQKLYHLRDAHGWDVYTYKCQQCPRKFLTKTLLRGHVNNIHNKERNVMCEVCGYRCFSKSQMVRHVLKHKGDEVKKFQCDVCSKRYNRKITLKQHLKIHFQYRANKCHICGRGFTQTCTLRGHLERVHNVKKNTDISV